MQMKKLYAKAAEYAGLDGSQTVLDLYCGIGSIGLSMAKKAKRIIGIEIVREAVIDANRNAVINGIVNARYICGRAEEVLPGCLDDEKEFDEMSGEAAVRSALLNDDLVAILDPPRAGCDKALLECIGSVGIKRIVYISCDPASLARDIKILTDRGYEFIEATPVDMFGNSMHVETVALLERKCPIDHIKVKIDIQPEYITSAEAKATYSMIKEYILEKNGVKVSNLYIAQVKDEFGIKERANYNIAKNGSPAKDLHVTDEKRELIIEALKHFKMIE